MEEGRLRAAIATAAFNSDGDNTGIIEDECHAIFDELCSPYANAREQYHDLFPSAMSPLMDTSSTSHSAIGWPDLPPGPDQLVAHRQSRV